MGPFSFVCLFRLSALLTEKKMDRANQQSVCPDLTGCDSREANRLPRRVIHFALMPGRTVSLRLVAHSEIRVRATRVWLTRVFSPYDYWVQPGDVIRLQRGERIWLSPDGDEVAECHSPANTSSAITQSVAGFPDGRNGCLICLFRVRDECGY
jgi:hypothetical protein